MPDIKKLINDGKYSQVIEMVNSSTAPPIWQISRRGEAFFKLEDWAKAAEDLRVVISHTGLKTGFSTFLRARAATRMLKLSEKKSREYWNSCSDPQMRLASKIAESLKCGDTNKIDQQYESLISSLFSDCLIRDAWRTCFRELKTGVLDTPPLRRLPAQHNRKILISGMGWSGSGAIYDYIQEFPEVHPVKGESTVLESSNGFRAFIAASQSRHECTSHTIDFFFRNMLGCLEMQDSSCFVDMRKAREKSIHSDQALTYANNALHVVRAMVNLMATAGGKESIIDERLSDLATMIVDFLIICQPSSGKISMLDNCIHIWNLDLAKYIKNSIILCCIRDPRSNYVSLKREYKGFTKTVQQYTHNQRAERQKIPYNINIVESSSNSNRSRIKVIQFEEFVISYSFRARLAHELGLNLCNQRMFEYFRPWESFRNTQLHNEYDKQDEIRMIEERLNEYCVEYIMEIKAPIQ